MTTTERAKDRRVSAQNIALPPPAVAAKQDQDQEWCVVNVGGQWKKIRFHDYDEIYAVPGLYETIFYEVLNCDSPAKIRSMLQQGLEAAGARARDLRVLDLGAGNGMVGEELAEMGAGVIVGVDIIPEAATAARRDRQGIYEDYRVLDMADLPAGDRDELAAYRFNALACVAALGFGDIPAAAFAGAYNLVGEGGWIAMNIKSDFLELGDRGGFAGLIRRMIDAGLLDIRLREEYPHRLAACGEPLIYTGLVGVKRGDIPQDWPL